MTLSKYEKETIILTSEGDTEYSIDTFNPGLKRRLADFCRKYPDICKHNGTDQHGGASYTVRKESISIDCYRQFPKKEEKSASDTAKKNNSAANFKKD